MNLTYKIHLFYIILCCLFGCTVSQPTTDKKVPKLNKEQLLSIIYKHNNVLSYNTSIGKKWSDNTYAFVRKYFKDKPKLITKYTSLKKRTTEQITFIDKLIHQLVKKAGNGINPDTEQIVNPYEEALVEKVMLKERQAFDLEKRLNEYTDFINQEFDYFKLSKLTTNYQRNLRYKLLPSHKKEDFVNAYFKNTPLILALSHLQLLQNNILRYEEEVIKYMILSLVDKK
ncbi:hypothetical protein [Microscilla marina]|uniref:Gliding motility-associated protein GldM N-terminal domain-containing protein n=1 Tax=Microscilla marina ATCC 23134 TaxID=313606 RepID=A1ZXP0_MICM2|nr:hypothetical protein [Microscilla marina]EAY24818.1 hypothetical protein M23134_06710 [Microscilla marina ATCC 23134]